MKLVIGGAAQGKLRHALRLAGEAARVTDGADVDMELQALREADVLDRFHLLVRRVCEADGDAEALARCVLAINPALIVVADEVGMGVVPMDAFERRWREAVGRALCVLAAAAESVDRMTAGIPVRIKGA